MKLLKRMAVLSLVVLALGGCTKSSISTDAPVSGSEEVDPAKLESDDDDEKFTLYCHNEGKKICSHGGRRV